MADTPTVNWDETTPPGTALRAEGDDRIREMKIQQREVFAKNHTFASSGKSEANGKHNNLNMQEQISDATAVANEIQLYAKEVGGKAELFARDEDGDVIQLTDGGVLSVPATVAVLLTGDQTIEGEKTFEGGVTIAKSDIDVTAYTTGSVSATNGSTAVTGAGTSWDGNVGVGSAIRIGTDTQYYIVQVVGSDTGITLAENYAGTTDTGLTYSIKPTVDDAVGSWGPITNGVDTPQLKDASVTSAKLAAVLTFATIYLGKYTGDGTDARDIVAGVDLSSGDWSVEVWPHSNNNGFTIGTSEDAGFSYSAGGNPDKWADDRIIGGHATGFTIDDNSDANSVNTTGVVYTYRVMKLV